jgi:hypothetical protein
LLVGCFGFVLGLSVAVGAGAGTLDTLLAHVYAAGLRYYGTDAQVRAEPDTLEALSAGEVGVAPGLTGRMLRRLDPQSAARQAPQVYRAMMAALPEGVAAADYAVAAEDKPALAVTAGTAEGWGSRELRALVDNCAGLRVGAVRDAPATASVGECELAGPRRFADTAEMFAALLAGGIDAAWTTTADPGVPAQVVVLVDRKPALIPADNVVALFRRNELGTMQLRAVNEIAGVLDTAALVGMLREVDAGADPGTVAQAWLTENPLGR